MQPENLSHTTGPEKMPSMPRPNIERPVEHELDSAVEKGAEKFEQRSESQAAVSDVGITTDTNLTDTNVPAGATIVNKSTEIPDVPSVAADEDLIEKEWVDKAKKIISETKEDPYARDEEVSKLQVEYIKKRYGRSISLEE